MEAAKRRQGALRRHLTGKSEEDVVVVCALRTPITKARKGGLKDTPADDLVAAVLKGVLDKTGVAPSDIGDIVMGSVLGSGSQRANECRIAMFYAGFPEEVPVRVVNRQCSSGLQAIADVVASIRSGFYDIGIAGGIETMSSNPMAWDGSINPRISDFEKAQGCLLPMGLTSENVAKKYGITRLEQDKFAVESHARAIRATETGRFDDEILPVRTKFVDKKTGEEKQVVVAHDDGMRKGLSLEKVQKLKPAFDPEGSTTAGNASQISDGAAATLLMKRSEAQRRGLPILGTFRSFSAVGVDPSIMGIGPAVAIPEAVKAAGLQTSDIDLFEINEAFASQAFYSCKKLGLDLGRVNVNGGAIALGHPLGCTGARCTATLLHEMRKRGSKYGVVSMCIGSGMGAAAVFERE
ncbi:3-ketoacyl-CoA thiolase [Chloropicon roscoffensis]|uniref:acetyl-CoA C-acyltransferase n=1 Tax=Chloropicon roscoffensis TaxID=1461544 RepID=A0A7S3CG29_9CHLO|mmetsp:Transcript_8958/g.27152  ORF Transcript_8958/g.27152 Transcript_8958/m.27152 type:complete len:409 (+) Transcript_8958:182-1408(+)